MDRIEAVLNEACEDQRDALKKFHETGAEADAARVHFESCLSCDRALDALAAMRGGEPALPPPIPGNRPRVLALFALTCALILGLIGFLGFMIVSPFFDDAPATEAGRMQSRVVFVRMPGRLDVCVATLRGVGGFGPTFLGASPCGEVRGRIESDEEIAFRLGQAAVVRIDGTDACLAYYDGSERFTLPCRSGD